jgi:uncharacterized protein (TIGR03118 family)
MHRKLRMGRKNFAVASLFLVYAMLCLALPATATEYAVHNLVSDVPGLAAYTDPNLKNPWGLSSSATSPFWVANNGTGLATLYNGAGVTQPLVVTIPPPAGAQGPATPTGVVFNGSADFFLFPGIPARFLFATEDGTISGWNPGASPTNAILKVDNSSAGAVYTGLALGNNGLANFLYAANFSSGNIDVFDSNFSPAFLSGNFTDPNLPAGYAPFNVQNIGGRLYITYAPPGAGPGQGLVDIFNMDGSFVQRLISNGALNSPWGLALAPADFGQFSNTLLVGSSGDGRINAFDPLTGDLIGTLQDTNGDIVINGLWGLIFGNGGSGGDPNILYFTAGPDEGQHGLFGSLAPVPIPGAVWLLGSGLLGLAGWRRLRKT